MIDFSYVEKKWLEKIAKKKAKEGKKNINIKSRRFKKAPKHFDYGIIDHKKFLPKISDPDWIKNHAFLPFVKFSKPKYKYKDIDAFFNKRVLVKKEKDGKPKVREIMYAGSLDSLIYLWYQCILESGYDNFLKKNGLLENVIAYRQIRDSSGQNGKCNIHFANESFKDIASQDGDCAVITFDITKFFPSISHVNLKKRWCEILDQKELPPDHFNVFKSLTRYSYVDLDDKNLKKELGINTRGKKQHKKNLNLLSKTFFSGKEFREFKLRLKELEKKYGKRLLCKNNNLELGSCRGIPQGSPISGLLANIYLLSFDVKAKELLDKCKGIYRRYSDDILVICPRNLAKDISNKLSELISEQKELNSPIPFLKLNVDKTTLTHFVQEDDVLVSYEINQDTWVTMETKKPLQYLGFEYDGQHVFIRSSSIAKFYNSLRYRIDRIKDGYCGGAMFKRKLYETCTRFGRRNYFNYVKKAKKIIMNNEFDHQLRRHTQIIENSLKEIGDNWIKVQGNNEK